MNFDVNPVTRVGLKILYKIKMNGIMDKSWLW